MELVFLFLKKIRILKHPEETLKNIQNELEMYHENCKVIQNHKAVMIVSFLLTILQLTCFYIVPYCVYRSFGFQEYSAFDLVSAQAFVTMVASYMPTPGGAGAAQTSLMIAISPTITMRIRSAIGGSRRPIASYMPTPGGAGAAEGSFVVMFRVFFGNSVKSAMVLWRLFTYYMTILVSAPFSGVGKKKQPIEEAGELKEDGQQASPANPPSVQP